MAKATEGTAQVTGDGAHISAFAAPHNKRRFTRWIVIFYL